MLDDGLEEFLVHEKQVETGQEPGLSMNALSDLLEHSSFRRHEEVDEGQDYGFELQNCVRFGRNLLEPLVQFLSNEPVGVQLLHESPQFVLEMYRKI